MSLKKQTNKEDHGKLENGKRRITEINFSQASKFRRVYTGVRKELFKSQGGSAKKNKHNGSGMNWSPESCRRFLQNLPSVDIPIHKESVSTNLDHNEKKTVQNVSPENVISKDCNRNIKFPTTPQQKNVYQLKYTDYKSPDTSDYLKLERICESSAENKESPVSSVCNLLENNMSIDSSKKVVPQHERNHSNIAEEIKELLKKDQEEFEETSMKIKEMFEEMHKKHQDNYDKIIKLVGNLNSSDKEDQQSKENFSPLKRRSLRLKKRSPIAISPVILRAGDLRKSTLTKSLVTKCQKHQINSPRIQNAISMYNSTRNACSALLTPKILKHQPVESPRSSNWRADLSIKLQQQCLLLQDTPKHN
ncbi:uncharacterized protein LOC143203067 isoform X1 [Rhynchophorus ferrugineus]|uniref:uncharacterized protein LOC143203067 isoform X1 n=1 Tax=Rhynchophorus ferrugineus TaxID=354439 RepID=UPI003FCDE65B